MDTIFFNDKYRRGRVTKCSTAVMRLKEEEAEGNENFSNVNMLFEVSISILR